MYNINITSRKLLTLREEHTMKKGTFVFAFIACVVIAALVTSSLWQGFGFALACVIFIFALLCIGVAICGIVAVYAEIKEKHLLEALKILTFVVICAFFGINLLKWLVAVLR